MDWDEIVDRCEKGMVYMLETPEGSRDSYWTGAYYQFKGLRDAAKRIASERDVYFSEMERIKQGRAEQLEDYQMHKHDDDIPF